MHTMSSLRAEGSPFWKLAPGLTAFSHIAQKPAEPGLTPSQGRHCGFIALAATLAARQVLRQ